MDSLSATARQLGITELSTLRANGPDSICNPDSIDSSDLRSSSNILEMSSTNAKDEKKNSRNGTSDTSNTNSSRPKRVVTSKRGRGGDPRMHRAVSARLANPKMSLLDALKAGGFVFSELDATGNKVGNPEALDNDNVQLAQRKNQLSRRIRHARQAMMKGKNNAKHDHEDDADESDQGSGGDDEDDASFTGRATATLKQMKRGGLNNVSFKNEDPTPKHRNRSGKKSMSGESSYDGSTGASSSSQKFHNAKKTSTMNNIAMNTASIHQITNPVNVQNLDGSSVSSRNSSTLSQQHSALSHAYLIAQVQLQQQHNNLLAQRTTIPTTLPTATIPTTFQSSGGLNLSLFKTMAQSSVSAQLAADNHLNHSFQTLPKANPPPKKRARLRSGDDNSVSNSILSNSTCSTIKTQPSSRERKKNHNNDDATPESVNSFSNVSSNRARRKAPYLQQPFPNAPMNGKQHYENDDFTPDSVNSFSNIPSHRARASTSQGSSGNKQVPLKRNHFKHNHENDDITPDSVNSFSNIHPPRKASNSQNPFGGKLLPTKKNNHENDDMPNSGNSFSNILNHRAHPPNLQDPFGSKLLPVERSSKHENDDVTPDSVSSFSVASANLRALRNAQVPPMSNALLSTERSSNKQKYDNDDITPASITSLDRFPSKSPNDGGTYDSLFSNLSSHHPEIEKHDPILDESSNASDEQPSKASKLSRSFGSENSLEALLEQETKEKKSSDKSGKSDEKKSDDDASSSCSSENSLEALLASEETSNFGNLTSNDQETSEREKGARTLHGINSMFAPEQPPEYSFPSSNDPRMRQALENYRAESLLLFKRSLLFAGYTPSEIDDSSSTYLAFAAKALTEDTNTWTTLRKFFTEYYTIDKDGSMCKGACRRNFQAFQAQALALAREEPKAIHHDTDDKNSESTDRFSNTSSFKKTKFTKLCKFSSEDEVSFHSKSNASKDHTVETEFTKQLVEIDSVDQMSRSGTISDLGSKSTLSRLQCKSVAKASTALSRHRSDYDCKKENEDSQSESKAIKSLSSESSEFKSEDTPFHSSIKSTSSGDGNETQDTQRQFSDEEYGDNQLTGLLDLT